MRKSKLVDLGHAIEDLSRKLEGTSFPLSFSSSSNEMQQRT